MIKRTTLIMHVLCISLLAPTLSHTDTPFEKQESNQEMLSMADLNLSPILDAFTKTIETSLKEYGDTKDTLITVPIDALFEPSIFAKMCTSYRNQLKIIDETTQAAVKIKDKNKQAALWEKCRRNIDACIETEVLPFIALSKDGKKFIEKIKKSCKQVRMIGFSTGLVPRSDDMAQKIVEILKNHGLDLSEYTIDPSNQVINVKDKKTTILRHTKGICFFNFLAHMTRKPTPMHTDPFDELLAQAKYSPKYRVPNSNMEQPTA